MALIALVVSALAVIAVGRIRLHADIAGLLPSGTPTAAAYRTFFEHFDGLELVFVAVEAAKRSPGDAPQPVDLVRAAAELETELAQGTALTDVRAGLTAQDEAFFLRHLAPRAPLLIDDTALAPLAERLTPEAIQARVERLRASLSTPAGAFHRRWAPSDPLGLAQGLQSLRGAGGLPLDGWASVFLAPNGDTALVVATPTAPEMDPEGGRVVAAAIDDACKAVAARTGIDFRCRAVGGPLYAAQSERLLRRDLRRTILGSLIATSTVLVIAFEGLLLPFAALLPVLVGLLWGAGLMGRLSPDISAISIGFGAVLVGLGVDYAIHMATRFRQRYGQSGSGREALAAAAAECGPGIATSALTTAAGFAILCLARLQPLRELGMLVAIGIVMVLIAMATVGGTMLVAVASRMTTPGRSWQRLGRMVEATSALAVRHAGKVVAVALVGSLIAAWSLTRLELDANPRALSPADPPTRAVENLLADRFGVGLDTAHILVSGVDHSEALDRARAVTTVLRAHVPPEATVSSPSDYLVGREAVEERLQTLRALPFAAAADALERALRTANLDPHAFDTGLAALRSFGRGEDPAPPPPDQWPSWLTSSLRHGANRSWGSVAVRLPVGSWPDGPPPELQAALASAAPGAATVAAPALAKELRELVASDVKRLGLLALAAVIMVVSISFRGRLVPSMLALLPVVLGALWTLGAWAALHQPLDLFCLAVLPILLGIGIDDGLHVMHGVPRTPSGRFGGGAITRSVRDAGRAVLLTTVTTVVGFASLLLSDIPGLRNGGALIAVGVCGCWLATVLVLPAIDTLLTTSRGTPRASS